MRCVAGVGLLALVGCNQIFGIAATKEWDAGVDVVPAMPQVALTWQVATVTTAGEPDPAIAYPPIVPAPQVRIAPIDVALADSPDAATYADTGTIAIPGAYVDKMWRLEYTLADGVPHEVQWSPENMLGHVTVPVFGRLQRAAPPDGGGYTVTPTNPPASYTFPRVFTTGLWTEGRVVPDPTPGQQTIDHDFSRSTSLSDRKGSPDPALGDRGFVVDFIFNGATGCTIAAGSAMLTSAALELQTHSVQTVVWDAARKSVASAPINVFAPNTRLIDALGDLDGGLGYQGVLMFGVGASPVMPGLGSAPMSGLLSGTAQLPVPMMLTLLQCRNDMGPPLAMPPITAQPMALDAFPHLLHLQITNTRVLDGLSLTSGIETVALTAVSQNDVRFSAAIPIAFELTNPAQQKFALDGKAPDHVAVGPVGGAFTLRFAAEPPSMNAPGDLRVDYYDVVLHRIDLGALTTERIYTVTAPAVRIDGSVLAPAAEYVFEVRSYKGHPKAQRGDFSAVDYPYGSAVVFTRTFKTS